MATTNRWSPATIPVRDPVDPKALPDIDFTLTPAERDIAVLAKLDILAMKAAQRAAFTPGLVVTDLSPEDLTAEQRVALGLEDA
jgi:hypothetical protein